jgi:hypothetical protein
MKSNTMMTMMINDKAEVEVDVDDPRWVESKLLSRTGVGWDKDFQDGTELMTKLKAECGFEPLGYNQNHVTIAIDI